MSQTSQTSHNKQPHPCLLPTYVRQPVAFVRGEGCWLYTQDNEKYLDALTGIAVCGMGHNHPTVSSALAEQAQQLLHTSNLYQIPWQEQAATTLCDASGMQKVFFSNSGAEANEAALKMARIYAHKQGMKNPKVIVMEKSFHGRTLLTLSATGNQKVRDGFYALDDDFIRIEYANIEALKQVVHDAKEQGIEVSAVFLEPIQGEGGINIPVEGLGFLKEVQDICHANNWLFMLDEIQTGNGRTGEYFAYQHVENILPDVLSTAKGIANGFPVGACLVAGKAVDLFQPGNHGSTYGGTPMQCRAVYATYQAMQEENVLENVRHVGAYLKQQLETKLADYIVGVRGMGMMIGIVMPENEHKDYSQLVHLLRDKQNMLINVTAGNVVRLLPTLNLSRDEADEIVKRLHAVITNF